MFLRIPNSRAINLKVVKLSVVEKCVFLVVFGENQVGGRPGWAFRREIGLYASADILLSADNLLSPTKGNRTLGVTLSPTIISMSSSLRGSPTLTPWSVHVNPNPGKFQVLTSALHFHV
jgi:hypothetical protein